MRAGTRRAATCSTTEKAYRSKALAEGGGREQLHALAWRGLGRARPVTKHALAERHAGAWRLGVPRFVMCCVCGDVRAMLPAGGLDDVRRAGALIGVLCGAVCWHSGAKDDWYMAVHKRL
jgi:hypothetical protein